MLRVFSGDDVVAQSRNVRLNLPGTLGFLAEALALVAQTGERHWEVELYRLRFDTSDLKEARALLDKLALETLSLKRILNEEQI